ncbi:Na+/H+ antiporter [Bordetella genomosp. 10]|uniref:Na+/H+ antiporter n=1 Tax=Bordetella genomosp. 10 TaxID=1416804 RepID=A0A261S2X3_9BORD|nr:Na+/H+ antiporter [Bordetella genomosp. 10]OZI31140.1 Na+/H+ antiporter [Bordetella genomosp. 10]
MQSVTTILLLVFVAVLSGILGRVVRISAPLLQMALGALCALAGWHVGFDPDMFLLLFIPPLLYSDAYRTPIREFRELRWMILMMAMGLVLATTLGCGLFLHWLIPNLPLPVCFTLAAVLSPTDAVAVSGMVAGRRVPPRFVHIVEGESLLNDASGLVCFKFAVVATLTGAFSVTQALEGFFVIALGGVAVGAAVAWGLTMLNRLLTRCGFDDAPTQITLLMLLPFGVYLLANELGLSGILAAVSAGLTAKIFGILDDGQSATRLRTSTVWAMIGFLFNALIFILFGLQLPDLLENGIALSRAANVAPWHLALVIVQITGALVLLRFVWVWISLAVRSATARLRHNGGKFPSLRGTTAMSIAGVRGAITLAAVLSLPAASAGGAGFPYREFLIVASAGVIVLSLVLANLTLPALLSGLGSTELDPAAAEADRARAALARCSLRELEQQQAELARNLDGDDASATPNEPDARKLEVLARLLPEYQDRMYRFDDSEADNSGQTARELAWERARQKAAIRLHLMRAERAELRRMLRSGEINDETDRLLQREIDLSEQVLLANAKLLPRKPAEE